MLAVLLAGYIVIQAEVINNSTTTVTIGMNWLAARIYVNSD